MATLEDAAALAAQADIKRYGSETPPEGPILAVRVADLAEKEAILAAETPGFFTIAQFFRLK